MNVGAMRQLVVVQAMSEAGDSYGQRLKAWSDVGTYWAEVVTLSGRELINAQQLKAEATHKVRMRWNGATILPNQRLLFDSRVFNIFSVDDVGQRHRELVLICSEVKVPVGT